jgi:hypothetical protein
MECGLDDGFASLIAGRAVSGLLQDQLLCAFE